MAEGNGRLRAPFGGARWLAVAALAVGAFPVRAGEKERPSAGGGAQKRWVTGYYAYWQTHLYPLEKVDWSALTHIVAANVSPAPDGSLALPDPDGTRSNRWAVAIVNAAHAAGRKAILMVGGSGTRAGWRGATSSSNRGRFVRSLVDYALKPQAEGGCGFDGIDLDWEPFNGAEDGPLLLALARELRAAWPGIVLTWPVGFGEASPMHGNIAPLVDQVNVMQYGMSGAWPGWVSWHHSALHGQAPDRPTSVESSVKAYLASGVPPAKLGIGIGFYASVWAGGDPPVTGPRQRIRGSRCDGYNDNLYTYRYVAENYLPAGKLQWDPVAKAASISCPSGCGPNQATWISFETQRSIEEKGKYVHSKGLGGTIIWTLGEGCTDPGTGANPLLDAVKGAFLK